MQLDQVYMIERRINFHFFLSQLEGVPWSQGKSQKEGQEDQGTSKKLGRLLPSSFPFPWSSWPLSGSSPGLPEIPLQRP